MTSDVSTAKILSVVSSLKKGTKAKQYTVGTTFGLTLAFSMLDAGYVSNLLSEFEPVNTNLWSLTDKGMQALAQLAGVP